MKKIIIVLFFLSVVQLFAQQFEEVIYLKNGSIIRGVIIEQIPNISIKVQTKDKSIYVYKMDEVSKIAKEEINNAVTKNSDNSMTNNFSSSLYSRQGKISIGGQIGLSVPMGDFGDLATTGFAIQGNIIYTFNRNIDLYGSIGYIGWGVSDDYLNSFSSVFDNLLEYYQADLELDIDVDVSIHNIPIIAGGRYYFERSGMSPYGLAEFGLNFISISQEGSVTGSYPSDFFDDEITISEDIKPTDESNTEFGLSLGGGILYSLGDMKLDVNAKFNIISDANHFSIMAGILFPLQ